MDEEVQRSGAIIGLAGALLIFAACIFLSAVVLVGGAL